jgi:hypothetical protein
MDKRVPFSLVLTIPLSDPPENKYNLFRIRLRPAAVPPARPSRHRRARRRAARGAAQRRRLAVAVGRARPRAQGREVRDRDDGRGVEDWRVRGEGGGGGGGRAAGPPLEEEEEEKRRGNGNERGRFLSFVSPLEENACLNRLFISFISFRMFLFANRCCLVDEERE